MPQRTPTLFSMIARRRPEWLAQGVFAYALRTEPKMRALILKRVGARVSRAEDPKVHFERPVGHWRADVVACWASRELRFELKLGAAVTWRQSKSLRQNKAVLVYPRGRCPVGMEDLVGFTWTELAEKVDDPAVRKLLAETDATASWWHDRLERDELAAEFKEVLNKRESWARLYYFLYTLNLLLADELGKRYKSGNFAWSRSKHRPYYGFWFERTPQRKSWFFLEVEQRNGEVVLRLTLQRRPAPEIELLTFNKFPLSARRIAKSVALTAERTLSETKSAPQKRAPRRTAA